MHRAKGFLGSQKVEKEFLEMYSSCDEFMPAINKVLHKGSISDLNRVENNIEENQLYGFWLICFRKFHYYNNTPQHIRGIDMGLVRIINGWSRVRFVYRDRVFSVSKHDMYVTYRQAKAPYGEVHVVDELRWFCYE